MEVVVLLAEQFHYESMLVVVVVRDVFVLDQSVVVDLVEFLVVMVVVDQYVCIVYQSLLATMMA